MGSLPSHPPTPQKRDTFLAARSHTTDDRAERTWTTELIVTMKDLCLPRVRLVHYSSYKFVGCWFFGEMPLSDSGNDHRCKGAWSYRAGVSLQ